MEKYMHWIDNADSYICPKCRFEARPNPSKYGYQCPKCNFIDEADKILATRKKE